MTNFNEQAVEIRQFLLGKLDDERAAQLEERIFVEPDIAEEVRIIESELIADYQLGNLSREERSCFEKKYLSSPAGRRMVEDEKALNEFISAKCETSIEVRSNGVSSAKTQIALPATEANSLSGSEEKLKPKDGLARVHALFTARPIRAYSLLIVSLLLLAVGSWLLVGKVLRPSDGDDLALARRLAIEDEVARLNSESAASPRGVEVAEVNLIPTQRNGGAMSRVVVNGNNRDGLIKLRLNLMQSSAASYRAVFLDDRRQELFAIPRVTARNTSEGPQVWLFVPGKYLKRGDYQIDLSVSGKNEESEGYAFRVIDAR